MHSYLEGGGLRVYKVVISQDKLDCEIGSLSAQRWAEFKFEALGYRLIAKTEPWWHFNTVEKTPAFYIESVLLDVIHPPNADCFRHARYKVDR